DIHPKSSRDTRAAPFLRLHALGVFHEPVDLIFQQITIEAELEKFSLPSPQCRCAFNPILSQ
ncbi:hypothetical protein, partial [Pseudomonas syringae]